MNKSLLISAAAVSFAIAAPAQAATTLYQDCGGGSCFPGQVTNVNFDTGTTGHLGNTSVQLTFSSPGIATGGVSSGNPASPIPADSLILGQGAATIQAADGLINSLTFALVGGFTFNLAEFKLENPGTNAQLKVTSADGSSQLFDLDSNGSNRFGIDVSGTGGTGNSPLVSATLLSTSGFGALKDLRLSLSTPLPEPATWAMMLVGFGFLGMAMRRRKDSTVTGRIRFA